MQNLHDAFIDQIKGNVSVSTEATQGAFTPVTQRTGLDIGDKAKLRSESTAELTVGMDCTREIGPNANLVIRETKNHCACAALLRTPTPPPPRPFDRRRCRSEESSSSPTTRSVRSAR